MVDVGGRHGVQLEGVGGVMRNAQKQRLVLLTRPHRLAPIETCLATSNERNVYQRRGLVVRGAHGDLRRLQMPRLWIIVQVIGLLPRAHT